MSVDPSSTPFLGRRAAVDAVLSALENPGFVTVAGAGGAGKTRLAAVVAERFANTVFVDASTLEAASELEQAARGAVHAAPAPPDLLVLDNLEQVRGGRAVVEALVASSIAPRVVCTARRALGGVMERVVRIGTLEPDADAPLGAASLFLERARMRRPRWHPDDEELATVGRLCTRLDGLPLPVELLAARAHTAPLAALERALDGGLGAVGDGVRLERIVQGSVRLLAPSERRALRALAVLRGAFSAELAFALLGALELEVATFVALVEFSLVSVVPGGYRLLETVRVYVQPRGAARVRVERAMETLAHGLAERWYTTPPTSAVSAAAVGAFARHALDWPHLVAAAERALERDSVKLIAALAARLDTVLAVTPALKSVAVRWFELLAARTEPNSDDHFRWASRHHQTLHANGDPRAEPVGSGLLEAARAHGQQRVELALMIRQAQHRELHGHPHEANALLEQATALAEAIGERQGLIAALGSLSQVRVQFKDFQAAVRHARRALQLTKPDEIEYALSLRYTLASIYEDMGDARAVVEEIAASTALLDADPGYFRRSVLGRALERNARAVGEGDLAAKLSAVAADLEAREQENARLGHGPGAAVSLSAEFLEAIQTLRARLTHRDMPVLGERDRTLLDLVITGATNKAIARAMGVQPTTVRNRLSALYARFSVRSRVELIARLARGLPTMGR
jgi:DNA-binding NarL/FixJ family response regulator/predicted ATPase